MAVLPPDPVFNLRSSDIGPVNSICFHQNERLLAGTAKGSVHLWDLQTNRTCLHFDIGSDPVTSLHHLDENLISQEKGGTIKFWSMTNTGYVLSNNLETNHIGFCRTDYVEEQGFMILPKEESSVCLLTFDDFKVQQTLTPETKLGGICSIRAIDVNNQYYILAGYESGDLLTWDLRCCKAINQEKFDELLMSVDYDPVNNRGICAGSSDKIGVFSYQRPTMELIKKPDICIKNAGINCLRIRPDQKVFASGGWDGRIRIFSWKSLRPLAVLTEHKNGGVMDIAYSTGKVSRWNAPIMAAAGVDGQITLWDLYN